MLLLTTAVLYIPFFRDLFNFAPISLTEYGIALVLAILIVPMVELTKAISRGVDEKRKNKK